MYAKYGSDAVRSIGLETPESLSNFDLLTCTLHHAHTNCVVLVDHSVIEYRCDMMLRQLHAYDLTADQALENWLK